MAVWVEGYQRSDAASSEQTMPATPLGPAVAVAVMYWVPEAVEALVGPDKDSVGR
jgi:hypothetical protein